MVWACRRLGLVAGLGLLPFAEDKLVVSADKTSIVSAGRTSVVSADKTSEVSQDIPRLFNTRGRPRRPLCFP